MDETGSRAAKLLKLRMEEKKRRYCAFKRIPFLIRSMLLSWRAGDQDLFLEKASWKGCDSFFHSGFPGIGFPDCGALVWGYGQELRTHGSVNQLAIGWVKESEWWVDLMDPDQSVLEHSDQWIFHQTGCHCRQAGQSWSGGIPTPPTCRALLSMTPLMRRSGWSWSSVCWRYPFRRRLFIETYGRWTGVEWPPLEDTFLVEKVSDGVMTVRRWWKEQWLNWDRPAPENGSALWLAPSLQVDREMFQCRSTESGRIWWTKLSSFQFLSIAETILVAQLLGRYPHDPLCPGKIWAWHPYQA